MKKPKPKQSPLRFARQFFERDMRVLPLVEKSKRPAVKNGLYAATTNRIKLKEHFRVYTPWRPPCFRTPEPGVNGRGGLVVTFGATVRGWMGRFSALAPLADNASAASVLLRARNIEISVMINLPVMVEKARVIAQRHHSQGEGRRRPECLHRVKLRQTGMFASRPD
jgi:hypothetical protein